MADNNCCFTSFFINNYCGMKIIIIRDKCRNINNSSAFTLYSAYSYCTRYATSGNFCLFTCASCNIDCTLVTTFNCTTGNCYVRNLSFGRISCYNINDSTTTGTGYLIFALISGFTASASRKKLKADKAAKLAAKAEKARAAEAKKAEKAEPKKEEP